MTLQRDMGLPIGICSRGCAVWQTETMAVYANNDMFLDYIRGGFEDSRVRVARSRA